jgi:hypothetical protein
MAGVPIAGVTAVLTDLVNQHGVLAGVAVAAIAAVVAAATWLTLRRRSRTA